MQSSPMTMKCLFQARRIIWRDTAAGFMSIARKGIAMLGIAVLTAVSLGIARPDLREVFVIALSEMRADSNGAIPAADPVQAPPSSSAPAALFSHAMPQHAGAAGLPRDQRAATHFLARKYRLAPDAVALLVGEAFDAGRELKIDPLLILAVMSIESSMNPFAQSNVGAQGLMQVMTTVHADRFEEFGGPRAALNPIANIRVGAEILKELVVRHGSVEAGLKAYVGATLQPDDGGYGLRVMVERARLESAVTGRPLVVPAEQQASEDAKPVSVPVSFAPLSDTTGVGIMPREARTSATRPKGKAGGDGGAVRSRPPVSGPMTNDAA